MNRPRTCRLCGGHEFAVQVVLEHMPVSHRLRSDADEPDPRFTLVFENCGSCGLIQIVEPIRPDVLYVDADTYTTSFHKPKHIDDLITTAIAYEDPGRAIDIGCNDGFLIDALKRNGYAEVVGIEPNKTAAGLASRTGHTVYQDFLSPPLAERIVAAHGAFDAAYLRHVAEHVDDLAGFFAAIRRLLCEDGLLVMELPQVEAGLTGGNPAILWEEHVNYFTEPLAAYLLECNGFTILERRHYQFGGGACAFLARKTSLPGEVPAPPRPQASLNLARRFRSGFKRYRAELRRVIAVAKRAGYGVAMYGAAPRSCMVAGACGISDAIDLVVDDRVEIQGRLMPGTERRIRPLADVRDELARPMLWLFGVGSENEFKVHAKIVAALGSEPLGISLFPPRDTRASIARVLRHLESGSAAGSRVRSSL